jgi:putative intracellular protease/amidase
MMERLGHKDKNPVRCDCSERIAIVISNTATSTITGWPVGFWRSVLAHPFYVFTEHDFEVEVFSPDGGTCQADAMSDLRNPSRLSAGDLITTGFVVTPEYAALVDDSRPECEIDVRHPRIDSQDPMFTCEAATSLHRKFVEFYQAGKIACALCHGVAVLR